MPYHDTAAGQAALSICEALLLALNDAEILPEREIVGILKDAAATHEAAAQAHAGTSPRDVEAHTEVAALINHIIEGGNSVRRK